MQMPRIRQAQSEDVPRMQEIAILAWSPIFALYEHMMGRRLFKILYPDWKADKSSQVQIHFETYPCWTFVIEEDDRVVGFLTYYLDPEKKIGEIGNNAVHPDCQGRGLGESMHREALRRFGESGMAYARVHTGLDDAHRPARGAYEKLGFKPVFRSVDYYMKLQAD
jgi:ribosomal protein S18 acetylase RimI-like enzyme